MRINETLMPVELEEWRKRRLKYEEENISETYAEMIETGVMGIVSVLNELITIKKHIANSNDNHHVRYNLDKAYHLFTTIEDGASIMQDRVSKACEYCEVDTKDVDQLFEATGKEEKSFLFLSPEPASFEHD